MKIEVWPETDHDKRETIRRIGLEITLGTVAVFGLLNILNDEQQDRPTHIAVPALQQDGPSYTLPVIRYKDLVSFSDPEAGTVTFVHKWDAQRYLDGRRVKKPYDYNFKYDFVVVAEGEHMFDKGSSYMPPDLDRDFDAVRQGFCARHQEIGRTHPAHPINTYCPVLE
jgi:hypothetical protein